MIGGINAQMQVSILKKHEQKKAYNSLRNLVKSKSSSSSSKCETINIQTVDKESANTISYRNEQNPLDEGAMKCIYGHIEHGESILSSD